MLAADVEKMRRLSADIRIQTVHALRVAGFGHIGGSVSMADVLGVLYGGVLRVRPENPHWEERDYLVLSKGHAGPGLYAALALKGFFPMEELETINQPGTHLPSHADRKRTPGVDMTTGSLGQGLSAAVGVAMGLHRQQKDSYTYCIVGDGELNEGQLWEAAETAAHFGLDHLIVFVDWNKKQLDGTLEEINAPLDIEEKFRAFGFAAQTVKGYDVADIYEGILRAKAALGKPHVIILDTIKGLGVSFAEKALFNHYMVIDEAMEKEALVEIERRYAEGSYPGGGLV